MSRCFEPTMNRDQFTQKLFAKLFASVPRRAFAAEIDLELGFGPGWTCSSIVPE